jgi:putative ABC transport system permease protein
VSAAQAEAELTLLTRQLEATDTQERGFAAAVFPTTLVPLPFRGFVRAFTAILMGAVLLVLLIACANAANLTLARAVPRRHEMAIRTSIGASRGRLMRQVLTESALVAGLSGGIGVLLTIWLTPALLRLTPATLPIRPEVGLDRRVFLFTTLVCALTALLFGFAPAWQATKVALASELKNESSATGAKRSRFTDLLIVGQVAVCLVLLIAGALCLRSLFNAQNVRLGFNVRDRVVAEVNLKDFGYSAEQTRQFNEMFLARLAALPAVETVTEADYLPLDTRYLGITYNVEGQAAPSGANGVNLETFDVGPGYFSTMGSALSRGREFGPTDRAGAPQVAIVNQAMADQFWPAQDAVGR